MFLSVDRSRLDALLSVFQRLFFPSTARPAADQSRFTLDVTPSAH